MRIMPEATKIGGSQHWITLETEGAMVHKVWGPYTTQAVAQKVFEEEYPPHQMHLVWREFRNKVRLPAFAHVITVGWQEVGRKIGAEEFP